MIQHNTVELNNIQFHYAEAPGPGPALLILHGLTGSHAEFLHLVPELAKQAHVYLLDLRGHGGSGWAADGYQVSDYGRDVRAFLEQVVRRPVMLMGHSLGGLVSAWLAANVPYLLQGVLLEDPPLYILSMPRFGETDFYGYFTSLYDFLGRYHAENGSVEEIEAYIDQALASEEQPTTSQASNERLHLLAEPSLRNGTQTVLDVPGAEAVRERAIQLHQVDPATLEPALAGTLMGIDDSDDLLSRIGLPVHLVAAQAELSGAMTTGDVQRTVAQIPRCTHTIIDGAGHDIHLDQPEVFLRELKGFLTVATVA